MASKYGLGNFFSEFFSSPEENNSLDVKPQSVRVTDIILDDTHPKFKNYGGWNGMGTIEFESIDINTYGDISRPVALPLIPYLKNYPLVNEIVLIFKLTSRNIDQVSGDTSFYYLNPLSLWNHPHHNAYPNVLHSSQLSESQEKDYQSIEQGSVRRVTDDSTEIKLNSKYGGTFEEKINIHPILPFAGDNILEGRFGNSIRLGNTAKTKGTIKNNWSGEGENGDPITIIRNGQPETASEEGWVPLTEDINKDLSSIYLTSKQKIPLKTDITNNPSINPNPPEALGSYKGNQILLNSNRLVFNTNQDSILLNSKTHISLTSIGTIGIFSREGDIVLQASKNLVRLGDNRASQSVILGDNLIKDLNLVLLKLQILCTTLSAEPLLAGSQLTAQATSDQITLFTNNLSNFTSKLVKTI